jgi:energy-coupling factor transporter transmembrane protein EcfT
MRKFNYLTKTILIVLAIAIVGFIASIFIYPSTDHIGNVREDVSAWTIWGGIIALLVLLVMLVVKKWRRLSFIPLSIMLGAIVVTFIFYSDGLHFKRNQNKSIQAACNKYCKKNDVRINPNSLCFINKEVVEENTDEMFYHHYRCTATAETIDGGSVDTVMFYVMTDPYNRCWVCNCYRVLKLDLTQTQLAISQKAGYLLDEDIAQFDWGNMKSYLRQTVSRYIHDKMGKEVFVTRLGDNKYLFEIRITPSMELHNLRFVFFNGVLGEYDRFSYDGTMGIVSWPGTFLKGRTYTKEVVLSSEGKESEFFEYLILAEDVLSDEWLRKYLLDEIDSENLRFMMYSCLIFEDTPKLLSKRRDLILKTLKDNDISEEEKTKKISEEYAVIYEIAKEKCFVDQFMDTEYTLANIKREIELGR